MIFSAPNFFLFFVIYFSLHLVMPLRYRLWLIIAGSTVFYAWWRLEYVWVPFLLMAIAYLGGRWIDRAADPQQRWRHTAVAVIVLLLPLAIFKYTDFFYRDVIGSFLGTHENLLNVPLPLGISFISFTLTAYLVDIYREAFPARKPPQIVLAHVLFFPHLIAGPILRPYELIPQLEHPRPPRMRHFLVPLSVFTLGLVKKLVFADQLAPMVTAVYAQDAAASALYAWLAIIGFTVQVYCDFSGYTDMAIGLAAMLGIRLPINFRRPFIATTISELWRRWHITLMRCLSDYVYLPISMALARIAVRHRLGKWPAFALSIAVPVNLTFLVSGIWHGAGWNFIAFGVFTGLVMTIEFAWRRARMPKLPAAAGWLITMIAFLASLCFFRARSPERAIDMMVTAVSGSIGGLETFLTQNAFSILLIVLFAAFHRFDDLRLVRVTVRRMRSELVWAMILFGWIVAVTVSQGSSGAFVYFDF